MGYVLLLAPFLVALACVPFALPFGGNLEYEYATLTGWLVVLGLPFVATFAPKRFVFETFANPGLKQAPQRIAWMLAGAPLAVLIPGLFTFSVGRCACSPNGFVFWMLVQVIPALWIGMGLFWLIFRVRFDGDRQRIKIAVICGVIALIALAGLGTLWFAPQKRLVQLLFGFLHGPVYDQWIPVDNGVVLSRFVHGLIGWVLACLGWRGFRGGLRSFALPVMTLCLVIGAWIKIGSYPSLGFGHKTLQERLPDTLNQNVLTMHYDGSDPTVMADIQGLMSEALFHTRDLIQLLGIASPRPIHIYVYPSDDVKKAYFGGGSTDVTDIWTPSIHITRMAVPHPNLRHELVHAVASQFGWHGLGFHPNMLVTEGLAVALAPLDERFDLDQASAAILKSGRIKRIEDLFSPTGFWSQSGGRAYTIAGSFLGFLLREASPGSVLKIYSGESFTEATGKPLGDWVKRWTTYVEKRFDPSKSLENEAMFRAPGVLRDICPHTRADYAKPRTENIWLRLRQPPGWDPATWLEWRSKLSPGDLFVKVELWRERIKKIASERAVDEAGVSTWLETVVKAQRNPAKTIEDVELGMMESDILSLQGHRAESQAKLRALSDIVRIKPPGELIERQILARERIEELMKDDNRAKDWRRYLAGWRMIPEAQPDDPWIAMYLRMRRERNPQRDQVLANALIPVDDMDPSFRIEWYKLTAGRLVSFGDYEIAGSMYRELLKIATGGRRPFYELQLRMVESLQKRSP